MKRIIFILSIIFLIGCTTEPTQSEMSISPTELTSREKSILEGVIGQEILSYDVSSLPNDHQLRLTVEHYHNGEKQNHVANMSSSITAKDKPHTLFFSREKTDEGYTIHALVLSENGVSAMEAYKEYNTKNLSLLFKKLEEEITFNTNEEIIVGVTIEDSGNEIITGSLQEDDPRFKEVIAKYQDVFVYKVSVSKDQKVID
ncbi:hypothetical protein KDJ21_013320 [Metabacillus litoralis]|uniref:hypothetical protein n=1 Tax=Metabacillus TaxID=2675233 RepID=UPI001B8ECAD8|nr:hypothetical protein [Metabacillus litoralis]UHA57872.1 hypothetical protein KDJ21_013320 [Metabacillus litoralis]